VARGQEDAGNLLRLIFLIESTFCEVHHPLLSGPISKLHHAKQVDSVSCILQVAENTQNLPQYSLHIEKIVDFVLTHNSTRIRS